MFSTSQNQQPERNIEFFTTNQEGEENIEIFDLNKIFQMNFSYNFDILKNLIEAFMKNQKYIQNEMKEKQAKILDLEAQLLDLKLQIDSSGAKMEINNDANKELISAIKENKDEINKSVADNKNEETTGNDEIINQIIVSKNKIIFIFRKK